MTQLMDRVGILTTLGLESDNDLYDDLIVRWAPIVTAQFESYCDRGLAERADYVEEQFNVRARRIMLWLFPIDTLVTVEVDGVAIAGTSYTVNKQEGWFEPGSTRPYTERATVLKATYIGGYPQDAVPGDLALVFATAVGVKCSIPEASATSSSSGSAIKSIGLGGGALSVQFDTGTQVGGIVGAYDVSRASPDVQPYVGVLDRYVRMNC